MYAHQITRNSIEKFWTLKVKRKLSDICPALRNMILKDFLETYFLIFLAKENIQMGTGYEELLRQRCVLSAKAKDYGR